MAAHILAIDQGTSATKCILVDAAGRMVAKATAPLSEYLPLPGWVEQDAEEIWQSVLQAVQACLAQVSGVPGVQVAGVGISTQRESALVWQRSDGRAVTPLLSWQDQRTVALRDRLSTDAVEKMVRERSGLPLDPMFSALKLAWLLDEFDPQREQARSGNWCAGTVDAYLLGRLGADFVTEVGNASRTQLLNVHTGDWDADLLALFGIPRQLLPRVHASRGVFATADKLHPALEGVPVLSVMADSHSALFAHGGFEPGQVKATLGTGSSVMALAPSGVAHHPGMCLTIAWDAGQGPVLALEGNIRAAGATLRWLADLFEMPLDDAVELASRSASNGVCLVPGFNGLGAPWWDTQAVGLVSGLTLSAGKSALMAAGLESIAHQVADVIDAMDQSVPGMRKLYLDGGPSRNPRLLDMLAGYISRPVVQCADPELSALGVAHLAGLQAGVWDWAGLKALARAQNDVPSTLAAAEVAASRHNWSHAVARARLRG
ncbi:glycerol kinase [Rhodoferax ferrireducens]|uniref:ATP:glycerol 3-phosphotransferase n=1 Tax=Rhodoferax ferrireducens TaxID=192843 RepID=A0ABU2C429_9BURK|nr:FGGY family carbohydrate kinase [Rhodoferax ferrireducens]MDR7376091.1 glycerol kinase [Rhodoferax ferrireducens]